MTNLENIVLRLDSFAAAHPERPAYVFLNSRGHEVERYSYRGFVDRTHTIGRRLTEEFGVAPGDRVALSYPPGIEMIAAFFACARIGAIAVPMPPEMASTTERLAHILQDCAARVVLTGQQPEVEKGPLDRHGFHRVGTADWPTDGSLEAEPRVGEIAFLQYTSGSTNHPKGVIVTHANLLHNRVLVVDHPEPVALTWLPQHHDMGLIGYYLYPVLTGGCCCGIAPSTFVQRPMLWLELITRYRATASSAPNFAFEQVSNPDRLVPEQLAAIDLSTLRFLMAAAEPIRPDTY